MYQGRCLSHSTRVPILPLLVCPFARPCENARERVTGQKQQIKGPILPFPRRRGLFKKNGPVGSWLSWLIPAWPVGWGKADGLLHQKNNYPKNILGEARTFFFAHNASTPVGSINLALGSFCRLARQRPNPLWLMGKMTFSAGLLTHPRSSLLKKSEPPAKSCHLRKVVKYPLPIQPAKP